MKKCIVLMLSVILNVPCFAQSDAEMVASTVIKRDIESYIYFLASDELKGRQTGTNELDIAASFIANTLKKFKVKPGGDHGTYYQNVAMENILPAETISVKINGMGSDKIITISSKNIDFNGDGVYLNYGLETDFKNKDLKGKIVIVKAGLPDSKDIGSKFKAGRAKAKMAKNAGAAGLVELIEFEQKTYNRYAHYFNEAKTRLKSSETKEKFLHLWMDDKGSTASAKIKTAKSIKTELKIEGIATQEFSSRNVIGYLEGSDPKLKDEFIIYSAHYDHVGIGKPNAENDSIYNGARDNAVGVVTVLGVAENFGKYPTKRSSLFILFTGEEKGLLGSKYYVENPIIPLNQMVYCFNSDNGGYNDITKATIIGLNRTTAAHHIVNAAQQVGLTAIDDPAPEQGLFDRSDNVHFAAKGIPAPTYSMGFTAFDEEIAKYYHQVTDNPDTLDYDYLEKFFKSYVLSSRLISNDPETPFWTKGDKYYEVGIELYKTKVDQKVLD